MKTKLLIFGITGDLSVRKLLPSLKQIIATGDFDSLEIIGVSRRQVNVNELLDESIRDASLNNKVSIFTMDIAKVGDYHNLKEHLDIQIDEQLLVYLAIPPQAAGQVVDMLGQAGINSSNVKLMLEKPFGLDLESARDMIERTEKYFSESQIYRIDHYLAKQMAQNVVTFRTQNALFSYLWSNQYIEKIEVVAYEKIGIEDRAQFYEQTGAIRDFLQGHLLQLLALTIMDTSGHFDMATIETSRLKALKSLKPADHSHAIRAQYEEYRSEVDNAKSCTETFVSVRLESSDEKWQGVPFYLSSGKAMDKKLTQIRVHFKKQSDAQTNCLTFNIQPHEGVDIALNVGSPDYDYTYETKHLAFRYPEDTILPDAYEQVIVDAIRARKNIFPTGDEILRSWEILQPLLDHWSMCEPDTMQLYSKGSTAEDIIKNSSKAV
jgi:glucose-6-phosphate 1-dehydrogenase